MTDDEKAALSALVGGGHDGALDRLAALLGDRLEARTRGKDAPVGRLWQEYWTGKASRMRAAANMRYDWHALREYEPDPQEHPGKLLPDWLVSELPASFCGAFVARLRARGHMDAYIRTLLMRLRACLNWARKAKLCGEHPILGFQGMVPDTKRKRTIITDEQVEALIAAAGPITQAFILALDGDGRRKGVNVNLEWGHIDWLTGAVRPPPDSQTKLRGLPFLRLRARKAILALPRGYRIHEVTDPATGARLRWRQMYRLEYREVIYEALVRGVPSRIVGIEIVGREPADPNAGPVLFEQDFEYVFTNANPLPKHRDHFGKRLSARHLYKLFEEARDKAGVQGEPGEQVTFHSFRHRYRYRSERVDHIAPQVAREIGGWKTEEAWNRYAMPRTQEIVQTYAVLDPAAIVGEPIGGRHGPQRADLEEQAPAAAAPPAPERETK